MTIIENKSDLKKAIKRQEPEIIIAGQYAEEVKETVKLLKFAGYATIGCALCAASIPAFISIFSKNASEKCAEAYTETAKKISKKVGKTLKTPIDVAQGEEIDDKISRTTVTLILGGAFISCAALTTLIALIKDYDEISFELSPPKIVYRRH